MIGIFFIPSPHLLLKNSFKPWLREKIGITNLYFFKKAFLKTLAYLLLFMGLIVLVDMMIHIKDIFDKKTKLEAWLGFYTCLIAKRLDVLIPFSIGIAYVHVLLVAQNRCEIIPLLVSGRSLLQILRPFFASSLIFAFFMLGHYQFILPKALQRLSIIESSDFGREKNDEKATGVGQIMLNDGTRLIFRNYSKKTKEFSDVFLLYTLDTFSYMNSLKLGEISSTGLFVQEFKRNEEGSIELVKCIPEAQLPRLKVDKENLLCATAPPKELSIKQLFHLFPLYWESQSERAIDVYVTLFQKLTQPLLCLLAAIIPMILTIKFTRQQKMYSLLTSMALLMLAQIVIQAFSVLARTTIISPITAILFPWAVIWYFACKQFTKRIAPY